MTQAEITIPDLGFKLEDTRIGRKDVRCDWDLGHEVVYLDRSGRLYARLWITDSSRYRQFDAYLSQEIRVEYGWVSGTMFPHVLLQREHRARFGTKLFRGFVDRALAELDRRREDPAVQAVFRERP